MAGSTIPERGKAEPCAAGTGAVRAGDVALSGAESSDIGSREVCGAARGLEPGGVGPGVNVGLSVRTSIWACGGSGYRGCDDSVIHHFSEGNSVCATKGLAASKGCRLTLVTPHEMSQEAKPEYRERSSRGHRPAGSPRRRPAPPPEGSA